MLWSTRCAPAALMLRLPNLHDRAEGTEGGREGERERERERERDAATTSKLGLGLASSLLVCKNKCCALLTLARLASTRPYLLRTLYVIFVCKLCIHESLCARVCYICIIRGGYCRHHAVRSRRWRGCQQCLVHRGLRRGGKPRQASRQAGADLGCTPAPPLRCFVLARHGTCCTKGNRHVNS